MPAPPAPGPTRAAHDPRDRQWRWRARLGGPAPRRNPIFGPEPWQQLAGSVWSHWDLWYCTTAGTGFDGDWAKLGDEIVRAAHATLPVRTGRPSSAIWRTCARLAVAELDAAALAGEAVHDKNVVARARRKVEALLWSLAAELRGHRLGYPAEVAMALVAYPATWPSPSG